jgi:hypothetical protein
LKGATPKVDQPDYARAILDFVAANAPDTWNGLPVQFGTTFFRWLRPTWPERTIRAFWVC